MVMLGERGCAGAVKRQMAGAAANRLGTLSQQNSSLGCNKVGHGQGRSQRRAHCADESLE